MLVAHEASGGALLYRDHSTPPTTRTPCPRRACPSHSSMPTEVRHCDRGSSAPSSASCAAARTSVPAYPRVLGSRRTTVPSSADDRPLPNWQRVTRTQEPAEEQRPREKPSVAHRPLSWCRETRRQCQTR